MSAGFTLVEVVVALVVLELGLLGALGVAHVARRTLSAAESVEASLAAAEAVLDSIRREPGPPSGERPSGPGTLDWSANTGTVSVRWSAPGYAPIVLTAPRPLGR